MPQSHRDIFTVTAIAFPFLTDFCWVTTARWHRRTPRILPWTWTTGEGSWPSFQSEAESHSPNTLFQLLLVVVILIFVFFLYLLLHLLLPHFPEGLSTQPPTHKHTFFNEREEDLSLFPSFLSLEAFSDRAFSSPLGRGRSTQPSLFFLSSSRTAASNGGLSFSLSPDETVAGWCRLVSWIDVP